MDELVSCDYTLGCLLLFKPGVDDAGYVLRVTATRLAVFGDGAGVGLGPFTVLHAATRLRRPTHSRLDDRLAETQIAAIASPANGYSSRTSCLGTHFRTHEDRYLKT